jgi:hypothetical protein
MLALGVAMLPPPPPASARPDPERRILVERLGEQDVLVFVSTLEWGTPDRWSVTGRYVHEFERERNGRTWLNNASLALSPGTDGGRVSVGYLSVWSPFAEREFALLNEIRAVLVRTWSNPLATDPNLTLFGAELRSSTGFLCASIGCYATGGRAPLWGFHVGLGI